MGLKYGRRSNEQEVYKYRQILCRLDIANFDSDMGYYLIWNLHGARELTMFEKLREKLTGKDTGSGESTRWGNTVKYAGQLPEDVFSQDELEDWAFRNGWREPQQVERFRCKDGAK
jgi:hypothetical protein